jgi:hypothetical protein
MEMKKGVILLAIIVMAILLLIIFFSIGFDSKEELGNESQTLSGEIPGKQVAVLYEPKYSFYEFNDPSEGAFSINVPEGWDALEGSGLIRPYIDAGVKLYVTCGNIGFYYLSPYGVYTTPNNLLEFSGFPEGSYYDPSGGLAKPMLVKSYISAKEFLEEYVNQINTETRIIDVIDRPDMITQNLGPLITEQSAAEITYISKSGSIELKNKAIAYLYLIDASGMGIWSASIFGYYSPDSLFNETEYLVLKSAESFKVDSDWATREAQEVNKRASIISSTQDSISETVSSTFEYRSESMDRINSEWSKTILGVEEVSNPETGETWFVDSGSNYYWVDNQNNIYGTKTAENPFPNEDINPLEIKRELG